MPVLAQVAARFARERPLDGVRLSACLHVTAETAVLAHALREAGAEVALCSANPLSTQDEVAEALTSTGIEVRGRRGESFEAYEAHIAELAASRPGLVLDDGGDLLIAAGGPDLIGGTEETTTGLLRLRRRQARGELPFPVIAVNEARTERALNDRHGTGQSALDGIIRASHVLLAGHTLVVVGYGWAGQGIAERARGAGAMVIVCEIDPLRALEARMAGYEVMPALEAAPRGDVFVTVTGSRRVLHREHFERMKDGAVLANAGHFDVELDLEELKGLAVEVRDVRPLIEQYTLEDGRRLNLLARGRVVNLAAGEGHPAAVMDVSFALQALCVEHLVDRRSELAAGVQAVPESIDQEVAALKLAALGVKIDEPTEEQRSYRESWT